MLVSQSVFEKIINMKTKSMTEAEAEAEAIEMEMVGIFAAEGTLRAREERFAAIYGPDHADYSREHRSPEGADDEDGGGL